MNTASNALRVFLCTAVFGALSYTQASELISVGISDDEGPFRLMGPVDETGTRVAMIDTETGETSNETFYTTRYPGDFTAMTRNSGGTLYAVQSYPSPKIVTLDETTGIATDVVEIDGGMDEGFFLNGVPGIAFVGDTLFAVIKREFYGGGLGDFSFLDTGFVLVQIDLETGNILETGIPIAGQYDGRAHGLASDPTLGLVHFTVLESEGDEPAGGATIEFLPAEEMAFTLVENFTPSPSDEPGGFQGVASLGGGSFLVFDNHRDNFYQVSISNEDLAETGGDEPFYSWTSYQTLYEADIYNVKAMSTSGGNFVVSHYGDLEVYDNMGNQVGESVTTSVGGFPVYINSVATNPGNGQTVGLSNGFRGGKGRPRKATSKMELEGSGVGLLHLSTGQGAVEVLELGVEFTDPGDYGVADDIVCITFDENGVLYGLAEDVGYYDEEEERYIYSNFLVRIDTSTGEITIIANLGEDNGYDYQLEYNPEDGFFYLLMYESREVYDVVLFKVSKTGEMTPIELTGDHPYNGPDSFVFVGLGKFFFTITGEREGGDLVYELDTEGNVTLVSGEIDMIDGDEILMSPIETNFRTTGLARVGSFAKGDVAIGEKASRLRGKNRYSSRGAGQSIRVKKTVRRLKADYFATVENDGNYPGIMKITGSKGRGKTKISYKAGGRNVTGSVVRGTPLDLEAGFGSKVKVSVSQRGGKKLRANNNLSISYGSASDLGKAKIQLSTKKKASGSVKPSGLF